MPNPVTARFIKCYQSLVEQNLVRSGRQFALSLDYYPQSFNDILKGRRDVTVELLRKATETYHFNPTYLLTGVGDTLVTSRLSDSTDVLSQKIPVVPLQQREALGEKVDSDLFLSTLPGLRELVLQCDDDELRAYEIGQDEEKTAFQRGDFIICKRIPSAKWSKQLLDGYIYVFVDGDGVKIDRVLNFIADNGTVILNRKIGTHARREVLNIEHILEVWEVKYRVSRDIPNPNNINYRTDQKMSDFASVLENQSQTINALNNSINRFLKQNRVTRL